MLVSSRITLENMRFQLFVMVSQSHLWSLDQSTWFFCLKTLPIMTKFVNLHMLGLGLCLVGITQFSISIVHAHLKIKCLMLMPNELMTNFVNAHAWVYVRWASSFSISIMHAHLKNKIKVLCLCPTGFNLSKIHLCLGPPGFTYDFLVHTLPVGYFWK